jgi:hypothetical protein
MEAYLRLTIPRSTGASVFEYTTEDDRYKVMKKNFVSYPWGIEFRTNDLGFRDNNSTVEAKTENDTSVIILGDSFTAGAGVQFDSLFTSLAEAELRKQDFRIQVLNLAVGGYEIVRYRRVFEKMRPALDPDAVVAAIFPDNDFNSTHERDGQRAGGLVGPEQGRWYESLYVGRAYLSRVVARLERMMKLDRDRRESVPQGQPQGTMRNWEENADALLTMSRIARENEIEFVVALLPPTARNFADHALTSRYLRVVELCDEEAIPCLNLLSRFAAVKLDGSKLRLNPIDDHPNTKYHALVAEHLSPFLRDVLARTRDPHIKNVE